MHQFPAENQARPTDVCGSAEEKRRAPEEIPFLTPLTRLGRYLVQLVAQHAPYGNVEDGDQK
jgi:hypothetical protein